MSKIIRLQSENFKRIKAIDITPDGNTVILKGKNAQGKTSILESIEAAFDWAGNKKDVPIRAGAEDATIRIELEDLIIERIFTADGKTALKVMNKEGIKQGTPQTLLDNMLGKISFDPLEFSRMKPEQQYEMLRTLVKISVSISSAKRVAVAIFLIFF